MTVRTPNEKLAYVISPVIRKLTDLNIKLLGTETQVLRITNSTKDVFGQSVETLESQIIDNVILRYPTGDMRIWTDVSSQQSDMYTFDLWDILPIKLYIPFSASVNYATNPIALKEGDVIVHVILDENGHKIPVVMKIQKLLGTFLTRFLTKKSYNLTLYRGNIDSSIQTIINTYVNAIVFP
jgi:hypothetical protein